MSVSCKTLNLVTGDALNLHRHRLQSLGRVIRYDGRLGNNNFELIKLIEEVCLDERLVAYPRRFRLDRVYVSGGSTPQEPQEKEAQWEKILTNRLRNLVTTYGGILRARLAKSCCLSQREISDIVEKLSRLDIGSLLSLVIILFPNLRSLNLHNNEIHHYLESFLATFRNITSAWGQSESSNSCHNTLSLSKLHRVRMEGSEICHNHTKFDFDLLYECAQIPSIRLLESNDINGLRPGSRELTLPLHSSFVHVVRLRSPELDAATVIDFIRCARSLTSLIIYTNAGNESIWSGASQIISELGKHQHHALTHFALAFDHHKEVRIQPRGAPEAHLSLVAFSALKTVALDVDLFLKPLTRALEKTASESQFANISRAGNDVVAQISPAYSAHLHQILPPEVEVVDFEGPCSCQDVAPILRNYRHHDAQFLPKLRKLSFNRLRWEDRWDPEGGWVEMIGEFKELGVTLRHGNYDNDNSLLDFYF